MRRETCRLLVLLLALVLLWVVTGLLQMTVLWFAAAIGVSIGYMVKKGGCTRGEIAAGCVLGLAAMPSNPVMGLTTVFAYLGGRCAQRGSGRAIALLRGGRKQAALSLAAGAAAGTALGVVNIWLAGAPLHASVRVQWFLDALCAGVAEEVIFRFLLFALCIRITGDAELSVSGRVLCALIVTLPHTLLHFAPSAVDIGSVVTLCVLFGLPFALLQRRRDLTAAMLAHGVVDLMRFFLLGI